MVSLTPDGESYDEGSGHKQAVCSQNQAKYIMFALFLYNKRYEAFLRL